MAVIDLIKIFEKIFPFSSQRIAFSQKGSWFTLLDHTFILLHSWKISWIDIHVDNNDKDWWLRVSFVSVSSHRESFVYKILYSVHVLFNVSWKDLFSSLESTCTRPFNQNDAILDETNSPFRNDRAYSVHQIVHHKIHLSFWIYIAS